MILVDRKVHGVGGRARRATATTIWTAWGTTTRVGYRNRHRASIGDVCSRDRGGELLRRDVGCSSLRTVPIHHRVVVELAAVNRQGETWSACVRGVWNNCRNDGNNRRLRGRRFGGAVAATPKPQYRE